MATSGQATKMLKNNDRFFCKHSQKSFFMGCCRVLLLSTLVLFSYGCASTMQMGKPPLTDRLDQLTVDVSTTQDIKTILGEPQGRGAVRSPSFGLKEVWLYEVSQIEGKKARMRMLMVFLDKDRGIYHGHLWFAAGMLFGKTQ